MRRLHDLGEPPSPQRIARWCVPTDSALVLGSTQDRACIRQDILSDSKRGLVRRRSGGGAVDVTPSNLVWIDCFVPAHDPLWTSDVGSAFYWLGEVWREVLEGFGYSSVDVHRGALCTTKWSRQVCFAGLGPGEVTIHGQKVVGISQRRTRAGALFHSSLLLEWKPELLVKIFGLPAGASAELASAATNVELAGDEVVPAFRRALPE